MRPFLGKSKQQNKLSTIAVLILLFLLVKFIYDISYEGVNDTLLMFKEILTCGTPGICAANSDAVGGVTRVPCPETFALIPDLQRRK